MEYNELFLSEDYWVLTRFITDTDLPRKVVIAKFNAKVLSSEEVSGIARLMGFPLPMTPDDYLREVDLEEASKRGCMLVE